MPIYYRQLVCDITVMLYLCKLTDYKYINDQSGNPQLIQNININVKGNING